MCFFRINFIRNLSIWKYVANYFPIKLHRISAEPFDPNKNYIFVSQPHGIFCIGITLAMNTEALNWSKLFPNLSPHISSHDNLFHVPFLREYFLSFGIFKKRTNFLTLRLKIIGGSSNNSNVKILLCRSCGYQRKII